MKVDTDQLIAAVDIAKMLGVVQSAVANWANRSADFPAPVAVVANGRTQLWLRDDILRWYAGRMSPGDREQQASRLRAMLEALERG